MDDMYPRLRKAVLLIAGIGVTKVFHDFIKQNTVEKNRFDKWMILAGSFVLGSILTDYAERHINARFNQAINWWRKLKEEMDENQNES